MGPLCTRQKGEGINLCTRVILSHTTFWIPQGSITWIAHAWFVWVQSTAYVGHEKITTSPLLAKITESHNNWGKYVTHSTYPRLSVF